MSFSCSDPLFSSTRTKFGFFKGKLRKILNYFTELKINVTEYTNYISTKTSFGANEKKLFFTTSLVLKT